MLNKHGPLHTNEPAGTATQHTYSSLRTTAVPSQQVVKCLSRRKSGSWHVTRYRRTSHCPNRTSWKVASDAKQHFEVADLTRMRKWKLIIADGCERSSPIATAMESLNSRQRSHQCDRSVSCNGRNKQHLTLQRLTVWCRKLTANIALSRLAPAVLPFIVQHRLTSPFVMFCTNLTHCMQLAAS